MASIINADTTNGVVITSDTSGEIELQANGVTKAKVTANGLQDANGNSLRGGSFRNLIINGDMQIAQRSASVSGLSSSNTYQTVDRFLIRINGAGTYTVSQDTDAPSGFSNSIKWACTTADAPPAAGDFANMQHRIEGQNLQHLAFGTSSAKQVTVSFWVKSSETGTAVSRLINIPASKAVSFAYTINSANTWEKKTITFPADTVNTITNNNTIGLILVWYLSVGTDRTSGTLQNTWQPSTVIADEAVGQTINIAATTSSYINITGVQLEVGSGASDFEFLPYDVQLARCQRYFIKTNPDDLARPTFLHGLHFANNASLAALYANLPTRMRTAPSITRGGTNDNFWNPGYSASATANFNPTYTLSTPDGLFIELSSISVGANSAPIGYNGQLSLNAEL